MKSGRGWWALAGAVGLTIALLLAGYSGAYYAMMWRLRTVAFYQVSWEWQDEAKAFFGPIHQVDRWLRPAIWEEPLPTYGLSSEWEEFRLEPLAPSLPGGLQPATPK